MRTAAVMLVAATAFVAAGCGGSGKQSATPLELVSQAVKTTTGNNAKFHMAISETIAGAPFSITADGASDATTRSAQMTMDLSSVAQLAGQNGSAADWKADVILDGTNAADVVEYMRLPALSKVIPGGKPWVKIDLSKLASLKGVNFSQLLQTAGQQDPTQALQVLQSIGDVKEVGSDQVDGVDTTHYAGTIDPQKAAAKYAGNAVGSMLKQAGTKPIPIDVWVDGDGYVRKVVESMNVATVAVKVEATMSDFGTKVDVTPPPADQTIDLAALLKNK
jgi:hypothetical protein